FLSALEAALPDAEDTFSRSRESLLGRTTEVGIVGRKVESDLRELAFQMTPYGTAMLNPGESQACPRPMISQLVGLFALVLSVLTVATGVMFRARSSNVHRTAVRESAMGTEVQRAEV